MFRRARLVDHFNQDENVDVFLLTTKVGGIGINLTGADRYAHFPLRDLNLDTGSYAQLWGWLGQQGLANAMMQNPAGACDVPQQLSSGQGLCETSKPYLGVCMMVLGLHA